MTKKTQLPESFLRKLVIFALHLVTENLSYIIGTTESVIFIFLSDWMIIISI